MFGVESERSGGSVMLEWECGRSIDAGIESALCVW